MGIKTRTTGRCICQYRTVSTADWEADPALAGVGDACFASRPYTWLYIELVIVLKVLLHLLLPLLGGRRLRAT